MYISSGIVCEAYNMGGFNDLTEGSWSVKMDTSTASTTLSAYTSALIDTSTINSPDTDISQ